MDTITVAQRVIGTAKTTDGKCVVCGLHPNIGADKMHVVCIPRKSAEDWFVPVHDGCLAANLRTFGSIVAILVGAIDESEF